MVVQTKENMFDNIRLYLCEILACFIVFLPQYKILPLINFDGLGIREYLNIEEKYDK